MDMLYVGLGVAVAIFVYMIWCFVQVFVLKPKTGRGRFAFSQEFTGGWESGQRKIRAVTLSSGAIKDYDITKVNTVSMTPDSSIGNIGGIWIEDL